MTGPPLLRDLRRLLSVPLPWVVLVLCAVVPLLTGLALAAVDPAGNGAAALSALPLLCALLGAVGAGAEQRYGTLHTEVLLHGGCSRARSRLVLALGLGGLACGAVTGVVALAVSRLTGGPAGLPWSAVAIACLVAAAWSVVGAAVGSAVGSQVTAVTGLVCWLVVVEPLLEAAARPLAPYLPARASSALLSGGSWAGLQADALRLVAVAAVADLLARLVVRARDVPVTAG